MLGGFVFNADDFGNAIGSEVYGRTGSYGNSLLNMYRWIGSSKSNVVGRDFSPGVSLVG